MRKHGLMSRGCSQLIAFAIWFMDGSRCKLVVVSMLAVKIMRLALQLCKYKVLKAKLLKWFHLGVHFLKIVI
jgi:hypothetical protein